MYNSVMLYMSKKKDIALQLWYLAYLFYST